MRAGALCYLSPCTTLLSEVRDVYGHCHTPPLFCVLLWVTAPKHAVGVIGTACNITVLYYLRVIINKFQYDTKTFL